MPHKVVSRDLQHSDDLGARPDNTAVRVLLKTWRLQFESDNYKSIRSSGTMEALHGVDVSWIHKPKGAQ